jgi:hypothetical protein
MRYVVQEACNFLLTNSIAHVYFFYMVIILAIIFLKPSKFYGVYTLAYIACSSSIIGFFDSQVVAGIVLFFGACLVLMLFHLEVTYISEGKDPDFYRFVSWFFTCVYLFFVVSASSRFLGEIIDSDLVNSFFSWWSLDIPSATPLVTKPKSPAAVFVTLCYMGFIHTVSYLVAVCFFGGTHVKKKTPPVL